MSQLRVWCNETIFGIAVSAYPAYSIGLAPSNYFLSLKIKSARKGAHSLSMKLVEAKIVDLMTVINSEQLINNHSLMVSCINFANLF